MKVSSRFDIPGDQMVIDYEIGIKKEGKNLTFCPMDGKLNFRA